MAERVVVNHLMNVRIILFPLWCFGRMALCVPIDREDRKVPCLSAGSNSTEHRKQLKVENEKLKVGMPFKSATQLF